MSKFYPNKKSQAALEFLTTYAWAFLVIIIVIAVIAYFGILRPQKILPDRCNFNVGFDCQAYSIGYGTGADGTFNIKLKNGLGQTITVTDIKLKTESTTAYACTAPPAQVPAVPWPSDWNSGDIQTISWTDCNSKDVGFSKGEKGKVLVSIEYYETKAGPTFKKIADGESFATVT